MQNVRMVETDWRRQLPPCLKYSPNNDSSSCTFIRFLPTHVTPSTRSRECRNLESMLTQNWKACSQLVRRSPPCLSPRACLHNLSQTCKAYMYPLRYERPAHEKSGVRSHCSNHAGSQFLPTDGPLSAKHPAYPSHL